MSNLGQAPSAISRAANRLSIAAVLLALVATACVPAPAPTQDLGAIQTQSAQTVLAQLTAGAPPPATPVHLPAPGPTVDPNLAVSVLPEPQPGQPSATANYNTAIMGGPGSNYAVYGAFLGGKQAVVVGRSQDGLWWAIDVPVATSKVGWVSGAWVTIQGAESVAILPAPPVPPSTAIVPPGPNDPQATAIANTYVRSGPGSNYPAYGIVEFGKSGRVIGRNAESTWFVVRLDPAAVGAGYGWVEAATVQTKNVGEVVVVKASPAPVIEVPPAPPAGAPSVTAADFVNVRAGPATTYPVLFAAPPGSTGVATARSADGEWWQVQIPTKYILSGLGWVSRYYVNTFHTDGLPVAEAPAIPILPVEPPPSSQCKLLAQNPTDGTPLAPSTLFETTWTISNAGQGSWDANSLDVRYLGASGVPLHQGADLYDLANSVNPGQQYTVTVPMISPATAGTYKEAWGIAGSNGVSLCTFWIEIQVQ